MSEEKNVIDAEVEVVPTKEENFKDRVNTANAFLQANVGVINMTVSKAGASLEIIRDLGDNITPAQEEVVEQAVLALEAIVDGIKQVFNAPEVE